MSAPGMPDLGQAGAVRVLAGDERRAAGGAALLAVVVGEPDALVGDPVDVRACGSPSARRCSSSGSLMPMSSPQMTRMFGLSCGIAAPSGRLWSRSVAKPRLARPLDRRDPSGWSPRGRVGEHPHGLLRGSIHRGGSGLSSPALRGLASS